MRLCIQAVPGAGKTRVLLSHSGASTLFLAYNNQLAREVKRLADDTTLCFTFHGLCSRCLMPVRDDIHLSHAVEKAERGELVPVDVPDVDVVLVDEGQDVRDIYVRLLKVLNLVEDDKDLYLAGDPRQLVYDFDPDFPANERTLLDPQSAFGVGGWEHTYMNTSHRLTQPMADFVNAIFGSNISSNKVGPAVEVRIPKTSFALFQTLKDVLYKRDVMLLVDRKRGNRPLRALLNEFSKRGGNVHVHGVDAEEFYTPDKIRCTTFWSSKGLEAETVIVLLPSSAPRNPTYVALTRGLRKLVVVLDPKEPHAAVCQAVLRHQDEYSLSGDAISSVLEAAKHMDADASLLSRSRNPDRELTCLDFHEPVPRRMYIVQTSVPAELSTKDGRDLSKIAVCMSVVQAEWKSSGRVRAMECILQPTRMNADQVLGAIKNGFVGRAVPRFVPDDALLSPDLKKMAMAAYKASEKSFDRVAVIALAIQAWDDFDHIMRQMLPVQEWLDECDDLREAVAWCVDVLLRLSGTPTYDTRLVQGNKHVRVHLVTDAACYHVVWGISSSEESASSLRAAMHPQKRCFVLDMSTRQTFEVRVSDEDASHLLV